MARARLGHAVHGVDGVDPFIPPSAQVTPTRPAAGRGVDPKPDSNVALLVGHHPDPVKVGEAAGRVLALAQTPAPILRGLTLHSG